MSCFFKCPFFKLLVGGQNTSLKIGVVASKKLFGKSAILRNRAKRRMEEAIRLFFLENIEKEIQGNLIFILDKNILEAPFGQLKEKVRASLLN
jgi:ribonuclease P protein component